MSPSPKERSVISVSIIGLATVARALATRTNRSLENNSFALGISVLS